jgi:hypothetical protein
MASKEVIRTDVLEMARVFNLCVSLGMQARHAPMDCGHAGQGDRLCALSSVKSRTIGGRSRKHAACQSDPVPFY